MLDIGGHRLRWIDTPHVPHAWEAGILYDRKLVVAAESEAGGGYLAARELLSRKPRPTAIFCFNDRMAMGAYRAAAQRFAD